MNDIRMLTPDSLYEKTSHALDELTNIRDNYEKENATYKEEIKRRMRSLSFDEHALKLSRTVDALKNYRNDSQILKTIIGMDVAFGLMTTLLNYATGKDFSSSVVGFYVLSIPLIIWKYSDKKSAKKEFEKLFGKEDITKQDYKRLYNLYRRISAFRMSNFENK